MHKKLLGIFILILLGMISCESSFGSDDTFDSETVTVLNNFGSDIVFELWKGEDLRYDNGVIRGVTVEKFYPDSSSALLTNGNSDLDIVSFSDETQILFVFASGSPSYYVNHKVFTVRTSITITVNSNGTISVN